LISVFGALTLYVLSSAAVLRLRRTEPELVRPYRTPLYPATPLVALVLSLVCLVAMVWSYPLIAAVYAAILVGSWLLFVMFVPATARTTF
jgi:ethanolamine permease